MEQSRKRIVKKESWITYITSIPSDLWLRSSEAYQVYFADFFTHDVQIFLSIILGLILNGLSLWLRWSYLTEVSSLQNNYSSNISQSLAVNEESKIRMDRRYFLYSVPFIFGSLMNAFIVFNSFRAYNLFQAELDQLVDSSGFLKSSNLQYADFHYPKVLQEDESSSESHCLSLSYWWSYFFGKNDHGDNTDETTRTLVLYAWNGPFLTFSMNILCCFSPPHIALFFSSVNWQGFTSLILIHFGFTGLMSFLVWHFTQLLHDREILFSQVQREHNLNLVYPQTQELNHLRQLKDAYYKALLKAHSREASIRRRFNIDNIDNFLESKGSSPSSSNL